MAITLEPGQTKQVNVVLIPVDPLQPWPPDDTWPQGYATVYGYVRDWSDNSPIVGATIWEGWFGAQTDANGYYILNRVRDLRHLCPPPGWEVSCSAPNYRDEFQWVHLAAGDILQMDWRLPRSVW